MLSLLADKTLPEASRQYLAARVQQLICEYNEQYGASLQTHTAAGLMSRAAASENAALETLLAPYAALSKWLLDTRDLVSARKAIAAAPAEKTAASADIDWQAEETAALLQAEQMVTGNEFYMEDGYYNTYVGRRLSQQKDKDAALSYAQSPEYDDLRCLFDVCAAKELDVLFVHVPLNGTWSDYTGFSAEKRSEYYENVRQIAAQYDNVTLLDLTAYEYEPYFLCDTMHLGWKGWLAVDKAITEFWRAA